MPVVRQFVDALTLQGLVRIFDSGLQPTAVLDFAVYAMFDIPARKLL